uniref:CAAX prenyl protease 2 n=1 Tax=Callorhinchus milii TaxID=7868 RepID=A0A4W3IX80_CALMI
PDVRDAVQVSCVVVVVEWVFVSERPCLRPPGPETLVTHFHHVIELLKFRQGTVSGIFLSAVFQFSYTAVFGAYTAFIFIRTGHLIGPVLCHSFCNYMGFPAIGAAFDHPQKLTILLFYLLGVSLFFLLLFPMTDPVFFGELPVCQLTKPDTGLSICT